MSTFGSLLADIRDINGVPKGFLPLHAPLFVGKEREYILETIDSTFVSSVGAYVTRFENMLQDITGMAHAVACVNGTAAIQVALHLAGVTPGDLVITQALSFVATANGICHAGGEPVFLDVDRNTLGLSVKSLQHFLEQSCDKRSGRSFYKADGRRIAACVPMHTFGLPCHIDAICAICEEWGIPVVEDAAEALGSRYNGKHCGSFGSLGTLSFNGNKIVTTGGGGAIVTNDSVLATKGKHLTTTAKRPHSWEFYHDAVAWNYRMPNLNAALGCAQLELLEFFIKKKRDLAFQYRSLFDSTPWSFIVEPDNCESNYWLCAVLFDSREERDRFLAESNETGVMTRPVWEPLHTLPIYQHCVRGSLKNTAFIADRLVNLPSGVRCE